MSNIIGCAFAFAGGVFAGQDPATALEGDPGSIIGILVGLVGMLICDWRDR